VLHIPTSIRGTLRRATRDQSGFTTVELVTAAAILAVVLGAVLSLLDTTGAMAPHDQERAHAVREAQVGMHRMTRELRAATLLETTNPYYLAARVRQGGSEIRVAYDCSGSASNPAWGQCVRTLVPPGGGQPSVLVKAFTNKSGSGGTPVFTYTTGDGGQISYVNVHVDSVVTDQATGRYRYRVPLTSGVYLRNLDG